MSSNDIQGVHSFSMFFSVSGSSFLLTFLGIHEIRRFGLKHVMSWFGACFCSRSCSGQRWSWRGWHCRRCRRRCIQRDAQKAWLEMPNKTMKNYAKCSCFPNCWPSEIAQNNMSWNSLHFSSAPWEAELVPEANGSKVSWHSMPKVDAILQSDNDAKQSHGHSAISRNLHVFIHLLHLHTFTIWIILNHKILSTSFTSPFTLGWAPRRLKHLRFTPPELAKMPPAHWKHDQG